MNPDQNQGQDDAHNHREVQLGAEDARAVDRWMAGESAENARDMRVADIFGLLNAERAISAASTLTDLTMVRVLRAMGSEASVEGDAPPELAPLDAEALDAWLLAEGDAERVPTALRSRAARHQALADLVRGGEHCPTRHVGFCLHHQWLALVFEDLRFIAAFRGRRSSRPPAEACPSGGGECGGTASQLPIYDG